MLYARNFLSVSVLTLPLLILNVACAKKENASDGLGNFTPFSADSSLGGQIKRFDQRVADGKTLEPNEIDRRVNGNEYSVVSFALMEKGQSSILKIPSEFSCAGSGSWKDQGDLDVEILSDSDCSVRVEMPSDITLTFGEEAGRLIFTGSVRRSGESVDLLFTVLVGLVNNSLNFDTPAIEAALNGSFETVTSSDFNLYSELQKYPRASTEKLPLGEISTAVAEEGGKVRHFFVLPEGVKGPIRYRYSFPELSSNQLSWVSGEFGIRCSLLEQQDFFGEPIFTSDLDLVPEGNDSPYCPLRISNPNYSNRTIELTLDTEKLSVSGRESLKGIQNFSLKPGTANTILAEVTLVAQQTVGNQTLKFAYVMRFPLQFNVLKSERLNDSSLESIGNFEGSDYYRTKVVMNHFEAQDLARSIFGRVNSDTNSVNEQVDVNLVGIDSAAEDDFVSRAVAQTYWMGGQDNGSEGSFYWLDLMIGGNESRRDFTYSRWNPGEPNNKGGENCVAGNWPHWNDFNCGSRRLIAVIEVRARGSLTNPPVGVIR